MAGFSRAKVRVVRYRSASTMPLTLLIGGGVLLLNAATLASYKSLKVKINPAPTYIFHTAQGQVTIAADPYETNDKIRTAFDLKDLEKLGIIPVNVIISNDGDDLILVNGQDVNLVDPRNHSIASLPIGDVVQAVLTKGKSPSTQGPNPQSRFPLPRKDGLRGDAFEIETDLSNRSLKDLRVSPKTTASGFVFFQLPDRQMKLAGYKLYIPQVKNLKTGKDLLFFEIEIK
jgi:hypothetical protein